MRGAVWGWRARAVNVTGTRPSVRRLGARAEASYEALARTWQAFAKLTTSTGTIDGDATAKRFEKQIVVVGLGNRIERPTADAGQVAKLQLGPLQMVKGFGVATPKIVVAAATGLALTKIE